MSPAPSAPRTICSFDLSLSCLCVLCTQVLYWMGLGVNVLSPFILHFFILFPSCLDGRGDIFILMDSHLSACLLGCALVSCERPPPNPQIRGSQTDRRTDGASPGEMWTGMWTALGGGKPVGWGSQARGPRAPTHPGGSQSLLWKV